MRILMTRFGLLAALLFCNLSAAVAQGSTADTSRAINGPANSESANQDAHKQIHGHAAHHHRASAAHY
jgi:hypothetical protein